MAIFALTTGVVYVRSWSGTLSGGDVTLTGVLLLADGTVSAPSAAFSGETTLGFWRSSAGTMGLSALNNLTLYNTTVDNGVTSANDKRSYFNAGVNNWGTAGGAYVFARGTATPTQSAMMISGWARDSSTYGALELTAANANSANGLNGFVHNQRMVQIRGESGTSATEQLRWTFWGNGAATNYVRLFDTNVGDTTSLATTPTAGLTLSNPVDATGAATLQYGPYLSSLARVWDTSASQTAEFRTYTVPVSAATPTAVYRWDYSLNGAAATTPMTLTSTGVTTIGTSSTHFATIGTDGTNAFFGSPAGGDNLAIKPANTTTFIFTGNGLIANTDNQQDIGSAGANRPRSLYLAGKIPNYNSVTTAGWGVPAIYGYGDVGPITNTGSASIATYTCGAADGTFEVSANCLVTTSTNHTFSLDCTYTDESNVARTLVLPVTALAGSFLASGLITNVTGVGPYESAVMTIRVKASTAITIRTSAGGTFTTVVYNARGVIKQVA